MKWLVPLACGLALASVVIVNALGLDERQSLLAGLADPVFSLDHFLALLIVGLWAGRLGHAAPCALPAAFLIGMLLGFGLVAGQPVLPTIEPLVEVLAVGALFLIGFASLTHVRLPLREAVGSIALLGGCHGYLHGAHGGDFGPHLAAMTALWFLASATVLLGLGVALGLTLARPR